MIKVKLKWQEERVLTDLIHNFQHDNKHWTSEDVPDLKIVKKILKKFSKATRIKEK